MFTRLKKWFLIGGLFAASFMMFSCGSTTIPGNMTANTGGNDFVTLNWTQVDSAVSYNVYRGSSVDGLFSLIDTIDPAGTYYDFTAVPGTTYFYHVSSVDSDGYESDPSETVSGSAADNNSTAGTATTISVGAAAQIHSINPGTENDYFKFTANNGSIYSIATGSPGSLYSSLDTYITLYDTDGTTILLQDDDSGAGTFSLISLWTCPATGTYYFRVSHYLHSGTGGYSIRVY